MTVCEMQCVENDESDEESSRSMLESFRSSPEQCQIIIKSEILADSIEGILLEELHLIQFMNQTTHCLLQSRHSDSDWHVNCHASHYQ